MKESMMGIETALVYKDLRGYLDAATSSASCAV
jgi:hypothetical protein